MTTPPAQPPGPAGAPPVTVLLDPDDDAAVMATGLAAHDPAAGHLVLHPTPVASRPASLATDLLRSLGKEPPSTVHSTPIGPRLDWWATYGQHAWHAATAWIRTTPVHQLTVTRAHLLSTGAWQSLLALRAATGLHLTVICHQHPYVAPPALTGIPHRILRAAPSTTRPKPTPRQQYPAGETARIHRLAHPEQAAALALALAAGTARTCSRTPTATDIDPAAGTLQLRGRARPTVPLPAWTQPFLHAERAFASLHTGQPPHDGHTVYRLAFAYTEDELALLARRCDLTLPTPAQRGRS